MGSVRGSSILLSLNAKAPVGPCLSARPMPLVLAVIVAPAIGAGSQRRSEPRSSSLPAPHRPPRAKTHRATCRLPAKGPATARVANGTPTGVFAEAPRRGASSRRATRVPLPGPVPVPALGTSSITSFRSSGDFQYAMADDGRGESERQSGARTLRNRYAKLAAEVVTPVKFESAGAHDDWCRFDSRRNTYRNWRRPIPSHPNAIRRIEAIHPDVSGTRADWTHNLYPRGNAEPNSNRHSRRCKYRASGQKHRSQH
jgi:hypothetical protein